MVELSIRAGRVVAARAGMLLAVMILGGCSADSYLGARALSVPGKFDWQDCKQLTAQRDSYTKRIDELQAIMTKAGRDAGGGIVNAAVHQPTLLGLQSERRLIEESRTEKNCDSAAAAR